MKNKNGSGFKIDTCDIPQKGKERGNATLNKGSIGEVGGEIYGNVK